MDNLKNKADTQPQELSGSQWGKLISLAPEYADKCNWDNLNGSDWAALLQKQP